MCTSKKLRIQQNKIFAHLYILKELIPDPGRWRNFITRLEALFSEYTGVLELDRIGFPEDWEAILENTKIRVYRLKPSFKKGGLFLLYRYIETPDMVEMFSYSGPRSTKQRADSMRNIFEQTIPEPRIAYDRINFVI
ncbi:hypothetical protein skT53_08300 [Effusibacillus dendaii]|uniref:Uncharacterized protein n=1 Tax=Effusibacillus dendaii TaxID=2743772 RepID=A0A7I8D6Z0_9BACL|nr:hypothetical protein skT53_08300 [Effusibacillus dendaii]